GVPTRWMYEMPNNAPSGIDSLEPLGGCQMLHILRLSSGLKVLCVLNKFAPLVPTAPRNHVLNTNEDASLTAGANLRRCVVRQDDVYDCCSFGATELLQFTPLSLLHPKLHRAQVERLVRRAMLIAESLHCLFGTAVAGRCACGCGALSNF
ncbi:MAG: hypothetical protein HW407_1799, partial [Bacteroidetes bacterium]|nr:hypothetical protein [Bacteroidota bacterium]